MEIFFYSTQLFRDFTLMQTPVINLNHNYIIYGSSYNAIFTLNRTFIIQDSFPKKATLNFIRRKSLLYNL